MKDKEKPTFLLVFLQQWKIMIPQIFYDFQKKSTKKVVGEEWKNDQLDR